MKLKITGEPRDGFAAELASLAELSVKQLKGRWQTLYGTKPPPRVSRELLTRAVAHRLQEQVLGGLKSSTRRLLERIGGDLAAGRPLRVGPVSRPGVGTVLIREWHGKSHRVTVVDQGLVYRGKRYGSLSEVARLITGSRWSGPVFFGLKPKEASDGAH